MKGVSFHYIQKGGNLMGRKRKPVVNDNFVIQSDFGIIEVEDGEIIYSNIK